MEVFAPFLMYLPQLSYDNMRIAYEQTGNISEQEKYKHEMNKRPLRYFSLQASLIKFETLIILIHYFEN